jgi:hypothetical protein
MKTNANFIHVNQHVIKSNAKNEKDDPTLTVKTKKDGTQYAHEVVFYGADGLPAGRLVTNGKPKSCGARCWFEPFYEVELIHRNEVDLSE